MTTLISLLATFISLSGAAGKRRSAPVDPAPVAGKKVVALHSIEPVRIELPDQNVREFGADFVARLTTELTQSGRVIVSDPDRVGPMAATGGPKKTSADWVWPGTHTPSVFIELALRNYTLVTGTRGTRMTYGVSERAKAYPNEFPLIQGKESWFGSTFAGKKGSRTGLDLGEGLSFDLLFAWLGLKWARFESALDLDVVLSAPHLGKKKTVTMSTRGSGYFYDVVAGYGGYSAGIRVARTAAMLEAFNRGVSAMRETFLKETEPFPLTAVVDAIVPDDGKPLFLLGTGHGAAVAPGVVYQSQDGAGALVVVRSVNSGAIARLLRGAAPKPGDTLVQEVAPVFTLAASDNAPTIRSVVLPEVVLPKAPFRTGDYPKISKLKAIWKSITGLLTLPYRIERYRQYDQRFDSARPRDTRALAGWVERVYSTQVVKQLGITRPSLDSTGPVVAIVDSGIDYNHPVLHPTIWQNPAPERDADGKMDLTGWDFISGDRKAFDDHFHGTQIAGTIAGLAPSAKLMALKAFNPWGATTSTALAGAITYAIEHGAEIIVCAWSTDVDSVALREALGEAHRRGVPVFTMADAARYPGALASEYSNITAVAAEASSLPSLEPRSGYGSVSGPTLAVALAAGLAARNWGGPR